MIAALKVFSYFSTIDGICKVDQSVRTFKRLGYDCLAFTDKNTLSGAIKLQKACKNEGMASIVGCTFNLAIKDYIGEITAYALDQKGYVNLMTLISLAFEKGTIESKHCITLEDITTHKQGLIFLEGSHQSSCYRLHKDGKKQNFLEHIHELHTKLGKQLNLCINSVNEASGLNKTLAYLANKLSLGAVVANDTFYLEPEDKEAHRARYCLASNLTLDELIDYPYPDSGHALSSETFLNLKDKYQHVIDHQWVTEAAKFQIPLGKLHLPKIVSDTTPIEALRKRAQEGLIRKVALNDSNQSTYQARLDEELTIIEELGFADYFLIDSDIVTDSRALNFTIGPGRGSGPGSLVAYCTDITEIDPVKHNLLFERFLNRERVSPPDFDIDICGEDRPLLLRHIRKKYGEHKVSQIGTFQIIGAKNAIRDAGRLLRTDPEIIDTLAKSIPAQPNITLREAYTSSQQFKETYFKTPGATMTVQLASKLEGLVRGFGKHAGGILISPTKLTDFTSLHYTSPKAIPTSQYDKDDVEYAGLVKFDFLGLRSLTILKNALIAINKQRYLNKEPELKLNDLPTNDSRTFRMLKKGLSIGVFQLESAGMRQLLVNLKPECFEDIVACVALFRPGPLNLKMHDRYANRKNGKEPIEYPDPILEPVLKETYGIMIYQEQVMQCAQVMAGYTLGEADLLRRAMGKKLPEVMKEQEQKFIQGAVGKGYQQEMASNVFHTIAQFAEYGFNKSHSAAYAVITCHMAYLKAHYPAFYLASAMTSALDDQDTSKRIYELIGEVKKLGIEVLPPDINSSSYQFIAETDTEIRYGLSALQNFGLESAKSVYSERIMGGPFKSYSDMIARTTSSMLNKAALESLAKSGALDSICKDRESALKQAGVLKQNEKLDGLESKFEFDAMGMYFSVNPVSRMREDGYTLKISELAQNQTYNIHAVAVNVAHILTKKKTNMTLATLVDDSGALPGVAFNEVSSYLSTVIKNGELYCFNVRVSTDNRNDEPQLIINGLANT